MSGNKIRIVLGIILVLIVVVATFKYGDSQRKRRLNNEMNLPTVESVDTSQSTQNSDNQNQQNSQPNTQPTQPNLLQTQTPRTGAESSIVVPTILGVLSGLYLVSRRRKRKIE